MVSLNLMLTLRTPIRSLLKIRAASCTPCYKRQGRVFEHRLVPLLHLYDVTDGLPRWIHPPVSHCR